MITDLRIVDLGVIDEASVELSPGLTVVTGETGAGKTMVVTGIGLLLGGRADPKSVRVGARRALVEGRFADPPRAIATIVADAGGELEGGELLLSRQVTAAGRSRCYAGGAQLPVTVCGDIAADLVTIHGQSEQVRLASPERQREIVDRYGGKGLAKVLTTYRDRFEAHRRARTELDTLTAEAQARAREVDLLRFGLEEIEKVAPEPGEDTALAAETRRLQASDDLRISTQQGMEALAGEEQMSAVGEAREGALGALGAARKALEELSGRDPDAADLATRAADAGYLVEDLIGDLSRYSSRLDSEPGRLEAVAARQAELAGLTRKYGDDCDAVLAWSAEAARRLGELEGSDARIDELAATVAALAAELTDLADQLTTRRRKAAKALGTKVVAELGALAMPHARMEFAITRTELGRHGQDQVELLFSANPGSEPRPLAKVASGGELSRIRLGLEVVLADDGHHGTFVFDEVDAGVGGKVAVEIGRRLATLARHAQVVVVTHLAQVAAFADRHYVVVKSDDGQVTTSGIAEVTEEDRATELARMMAGLDTSESALAHAGELLATVAAHRTGG
ncbi:MAG: DNA repair protein RecN [Propionibacteriaceae bacterium]